MVESEKRFRIFFRTQLHAIRIMKPGVLLCGFFMAVSESFVHVLHGFITHHNNLNRYKRFTCKTSR